MLKNISRFESLKEGKICHIYLDSDTPLHVAKEMAFDFIKFLGQIEDQAKASQQQQSEKSEEQEVVIQESTEV